MKIYLDSAYIAKCYLNEPESSGVRELVRTMEGLYSSALCVTEVACALHRHLREGKLGRDEAAHVWTAFSRHIETGAWLLLPVSDTLLFQSAADVAELPAQVFLRTGDVIHLTTARKAGFSEIWSNDRHLLKAAVAFGLTGRSV